MLRTVVADAIRAAARRVENQHGRRPALAANFVDWAIRHRPSDAPILEIGSFCGLSTNVLVYFLGKLGSPQRLFTCDPWTFERAMTNGAPVSRDAYAAFVKRSYLHGIETFSAHRR